MRRSLNEIEAQLRKAARGAGHSWGLAEEAGKAGRWLAMHGIDGLSAFAALFEQNDGRSYDEMAPRSSEGIWRAGDGRLCPLIAGAALADRAEDFANGSTVRLATISWPILLAPFAATVASVTGAPIALEWPGVLFTFEDAGIRVEAASDVSTTASAPHASCRRLASAAQGRILRPEIVGAIVAPDVWRRLDSFVQRTYVPASEQSRLKGAGAGLLDTD
jgi:Protein of unknown function (DUF3726)